MTTLPTILQKLPMPNANTIHTRLGENTSKLKSGATINYEGQTWNVKMQSSRNGCYMRVHNAQGYIYGAFFSPDDDPSKLLQDRFEIIPPENTLSEEAFQGADKLFYPQNILPLSLKILTFGNLVDDEPSPKLAKEIHELAQEWFTSRGSMNSLMPQVARTVVENSRDDAVYREHQAAFLNVFKGIAIFLAAYYIARFSTQILKMIKGFKPPLPAQIPTEIS